MSSESLEDNNAQRATWVSVAVNIVLSAAQVLIGLSVHSQALISDGIHSLSDLVSDFVVLIAGKQSKKAPDEDHPYGHHRFETAASLILGVILLGVGFGMLVKAGNTLQSDEPLAPPSLLALGIALTALVSKEALFRYQMREAQRLNSSLLAANAWHSRSDAASSLVVAIGIGGAWLGYGYLDPMAAALVGFMVCKMGAQFGWAALSDLMDRGVDQENIDAIRKVIEASAGVRHVHGLRTRKMGDHVLLDVHVGVDPRISVSEGHFIAESTRKRLIQQNLCLDALIHIDPEEDDAAASSWDLPSRETVLLQLHERLGALHQTRVKNTVLHYLEGAIEVELSLDQEGLDETALDDLSQKLAQWAQEMKHIRHIELNSPVQSRP